MFRIEYSSRHVARHILPTHTKSFDARNSVQGSDDFDDSAGGGKPAFAFEDDEDGGDAESEVSVQYKKKNKSTRKLSYTTSLRHRYAMRFTDKAFGPPVLKQEEEEVDDDSDTLTGSVPPTAYVRALLCPELRSRAAPPGF